MKKPLKITAWVLAFIISLTVLFYAEENWRGARAWKKTTAELQAKGYPLTIAETIPPPVADDDNIAAAPIFAELFTASGDINPEARLIKVARLFGTAQKGRFPYIQTGSPGDLRLHVDPPDHTLTVNQAARDLLAQLEPEWQPLLAEAHAALQRPQCRWPLAYGRGFDLPLPHLSPCVELAKVLHLRARCYLEIGESEKAADDLVDIFKLAQAIECNPTLVDFLVAITQRGYALPVIWSGIVNQQWRDEDLARLSQAVAAHNGFEELKQGYIKEQTFMMAIDADVVEWSSAYIKSFNEPSRRQKWDALLIRAIPLGVILSDKSFYVRWMQVNLDAINVEEQTVSVPLCEANDATLAQLGGWLNGAFHVFTKLLAPGAWTSTIIKKLAQMEVMCHQALLACALEQYRLRHGKLPLTLNELVPDYLEQIPNQVTVSEPMHYRRVSDQDYLLYSIGWNLQDDSGTISDDTRADKLDWVWASKPELYQRRKVTEEYNQPSKKGSVVTGLLPQPTFLQQKYLRK
ncbi:MAG: hypothetical protein LBK60_02725 [Verrucomicrobiales bacterium]|jgi:hypothetical protein|nr:hypothetical protein [Verrucomicrobiales bacterium]